MWGQKGQAKLQYKSICNSNIFRIVSLAWQKMKDCVNFEYLNKQIFKYLCGDYIDLIAYPVAYK